MCSVRNPTSQRRPLGNGSSTHLQKRGSQSHHKHPTCRPQHPEPVRVDDRRIEVIPNGLPMWGGSQLAVDTTLVSPLTRSGEPRSRGGTYAGAALQDARRSKEKPIQELLQNRRCRLVVLGIDVRGRWSNEASNFIRCLPTPEPAPAPLHSKQSPARRDMSM